MKPERNPARLERLDSELNTTTPLRSVIRRSRVCLLGLACEGTQQPARAQHNLRP
jgi:hypothetical protein